MRVKKCLSILLTLVMVLSLLTGAALAAEEPDYTSVEVTEDSFESVMDLADRLHDENQKPGTGGGFTWDSEEKKRSWTYYNGIIMDAFLMLDSEKFESYVNTFYNNNVTSQGQVNSSGAADNYYRGNELDSIPPTRALFDLLRSNSVSDAEKNNYKRMIDYVYSVMSRFDVIPGTAGNFRYKMNNANWATYQLALDGMYMAQPFFMELANALDDGTLTLEDFTSYTGPDENLEDTDKIYSAVFDRMYWVGDNLYDDGNGLFNHAWGPDAGLNGQYWLRAVGWYAAALADVISMLPDDFERERNMLIEIEARLFDGMIAHRDRDTGLWYNVIKYGPELAGPESMNQLESSGSALMAYAMMRSYAEGYVERRYGAAGLRAFNAIAALKLDEGGLHDVYLSSGVETTPEGYLSKPYVTNDAKGVGPLFMAAAWAKQAADLYNQPVAVPLCALDGDTNEALPGVTAQVLGPDGALVAEWNSGTEALPVEGILPGAEYTIHVISAPAGYALPEDAVFSLNKETLQITLNGTPIDDGVIDIRLFKNKVSIVTEIIPEGGGTVTADPANPAAGDLVTLTVTPAAGYVLGTLTATDEAGNEIFLDDGQFLMPEGSVTVTATFEPAAPEFKSKSLVLSGQIGMNFFMKLPEIEGVDYSNSYMTFSITGKGTTTARDNYDATFKDESGNGYYGFTCFVNSIQMADTITATFHYGDDQTVSLDYSVADYIAYFDEHPSEYNQTTLDLIKAIADYGHYAQPFLSVENGWTIGTDYAEMAKHYTESFDLDSIKTAIDGYTFVKNIEGSGITKATYRLNLESETMVDVFLTVEDGTELTASATFNGKTFTAVKQADGRYRIRVSGISAHLLGETIKITGTAGSDFTITVSALAYARAVLNSEAFNADAKNAMAALYRYYAAVEAYNS